MMDLGKILGKINFIFYTKKFYSNEKYRRESCIKEDIYNYHKYFDIVDYLNNRLLKIY